MGQAWDVIFFGAPIDATQSHQKLLQFLAHRIVIAGIVSHDTREFLQYVVLEKDTVHMISKIDSGMAIINLRKVEKILMWDEILVDIVARNCYYQRGSINGCSLIVSLPHMIEAIYHAT